MSKTRLDTEGGVKTAKWGRLVKKLNCWEFKKCGREPGGLNVDELGVCPAAVMKKADGIHDGKDGGRYCWTVAGTFCLGKIQGTFAQKTRDCYQCDFYLRVLKEEGIRFKY